MNYPVIFQIGAELALSVLIIRRIRGWIRKHILRYIPVDKRISDDGFHLQNRYSIIVASIGILILTMLFHLGINQFKRYISKQPKETIVTPVAEQAAEQTAEIPFAQPPTIDTPVTESELKDVLPPKPQPPKVIESPDSTPDWYAQVHAISLLNLAKNAQQQQTAPANRQVYLAHFATDPQPYKILIGPFSDRRSTQAYIQAHALNAWPRQVPSSLLIT